MIGRKSIVGLSLLAVFAFCALAAQGASAAWQTSNKSTAWTCAPNGGKKDFSDAHCDHTVAEGTGSFGHVEIAKSTQTPITITNEKTASNTTAAQPVALNSELFGVPVTITCQKVANAAGSTSYIENTEPSAGNMQVHGTIWIDITLCGMEGIPCEVAEPITIHILFHAVEEPTKGAMALEFTPTEGSTTLTTIHFKPGCFIEEAPIEGKLKSTGGTGSTANESGATSVFEGGNEMSELSLGGSPATFTGKFTTRMEKVNGVEQNPITITTN
jgi:hypothetical protein